MRGILIICLGFTLAGCTSPFEHREEAVPELPSAVEAEINPVNFDRGLLALAIFQESNRVRRELGLPPFRWLATLNDAADLEAAVGKVYQPPSHTNPFPMIGTPMERVKYVGLDPGHVAENIAILSVYDVPPQVGVGVMRRDGRRVLVHPETGQALRRATYRGFAARIVEAWMNSPGHRVNLVNPALVYLGCSAQPSVSLSGVDQLFCVQVFFTRRS